jgi:hypothetical protein
MLLQDLLVATVLLEQMNNYTKQGGKKIYQLHHKRKHAYTSLLFSLHFKFGVVIGMSTLHFCDPRFKSQ